MEAPPHPFVIRTEAQRSGEISVLMLRLGNVFGGLERSAVQRNSLGKIKKMLDYLFSAVVKYNSNEKATWKPDGP
jgi:hypothetical protein